KYGIETKNIELAEPMRDRHLEFSGMAWHGDRLILLPQYPSDTPAGGFVYAVSRSVLHDCLDGKKQDTIEFEKIPFDARELEEAIGGKFEGYESIAFQGNRAYLTVELARKKGALLVTGTLTPGGGLRLENRILMEMKSQSGVGNMSDESLLISGDKIITLHEANALRDEENYSPEAHVFDISNGSTTTIGMLKMSHRITDATSVDGEGRFWVMNQHYKDGEPELKPVDGPVSTERLVELKVTNSGIKRSGRPGIMLAENKKKTPNWEGLVRFPGRGFLAVTDSHPRTNRLMFIPYAGAGR
ncbi:MAG: hypothetical protein V3U37_03870, partial [Nitrospinaceae bacterium]